MGGFHSTSLKEAITSHNTDRLASFLSSSTGDQESNREALNRPLNRKGDTALILAIRHEHYDLVGPLLEAGSSIHVKNRLRETALDLLFARIQLEQKQAQDEPTAELPTKVYRTENQDGTTDSALRCLLQAGANGTSLQKLALHFSEDHQKLNSLCQMIPDSTLLSDTRLGCLLMQLATWCNHQNLLEDLLHRGLEPYDFWHTPFMPVIVPNTVYRGIPWPKTEEGEYFIPSLPEPESVQAVKWGMLQDWRAEWEGEHLTANQYKAGLQLTPSAAVTFIKAANHPMVLVRICTEILTYLPPLCGGPDLRTSPIIPLLVLSGYIFSPEEIQQLTLKYSQWSSVEALCKNSKKVQSLKHICRLQLRCMMKFNVICSVAKMQLVPEKIKQYLCFDDQETQRQIMEQVVAAMPVEM